MAEHDHGGHRQRIIKKLEQGVLLEHELLEVFLFNAIPRRNTNDIAHRLLSRFVTIRGVFSASIDDLKTVDGVGESVAAYIVCAGKIFEKFYDFDKSVVPVYFEQNSFFSFVKSAYAKETKEVLDFYLFDSEKKIFNRRRYTRLDSSRVDIEPIEFTKMLLEEKPIGIVAVHNHPNGTCAPSPADDMTTARLCMATSFNNVLFCDHFIYGKDGIYSYYLDGKMKEYSELYSVNTIAKKATDDTVKNG
jgi:DNA repair protein RadC